MPVAQSLADADGLMVVTDKAVENRASRRVAGDVLAHYQLMNSRDLGRDVYWVESYGPDGKFESGHLVELVDDSGLWASCDCRWFIEWRKSQSNTVCKHILSAVQMQKVRG